MEVLVNISVRDNHHRMTPHADIIIRDALVLDVDEIEAMIADQLAEKLEGIEDLLFESKT